MKAISQSARILVVDDSQMNRDLLLRYITRDGHSVVTAENGVQALEYLHNEAFDLVLLDIMMPKLDGYQVLEAIRDDDFLSHIPVLVLSAVSDTNSIVRALKLGAQDYIAKPFDATVLHARVSASLDRKWLHDGEQQYLHQIEREKKQIQDLLQVVIPIGIELTTEPDFDQLLEKILMGGKRLCNADGGTLYLRTSNDTLEYVIVQNDTLRISLSASDEKPEIFAPIALFDETGEVTNQDFSARRVIATKQTINLAGEDQFDHFPNTQLFDTQLSYKTASLLTVPLVNNQEHVIGALQYANARDESTGESTVFSPNLQQLVEALAALAAAALEGYIRKAQLQNMIEELRVKVVVDNPARQEQVKRLEETDFFVRLRSYIQDFRAQDG